MACLIDILDTRCPDYIMHSQKFVFSGRRLERYRLFVERLVQNVIMTVAFAAELRV